MYIEWWWWWHMIFYSVALWNKIHKYVLYIYYTHTLGIFDKNSIFRKTIFQRLYILNIELFNPRQMLFYSLFEAWRHRPIMCLSQEQGTPRNMHKLIIIALSWRAKSFEYPEIWKLCMTYLQTNELSRLPLNITICFWGVTTVEFGIKKSLETF